VALQSAVGVLQWGMPDLTIHLVARDDYRISFDGVEVGSISKRTHPVHTHHSWHWGVDIMPLMDHGGRPPLGDADSFPAALDAFRSAFTLWHQSLAPSLWEKNRD
jgi:hypothetical protein